ncbi:hypothetical protein [Rhodobacter sp. CZR27]|uniref:hypothetical protein n=1 Tax=Rhodobacter sp. CZR27 TaxID=2033869 RepID=UPI0012FD198A|nr:hypothetical protein [Rhodobacter sp. CZR27]
MLSSFAQGLADGLAGPPHLDPDVPGQRWARPVGHAAPSGPPAGPAPLAVAMQVCLPASLWDWPSDSLGSVSAKLYEFVSYVPERPDDWGAYGATTDRVSDAYGLFLSALQPNATVQAAQAALAEPANQTQVQFPNGPMMMPNWTVTETPSQFVSNVAGRPDLASTIVVDLAGTSDGATSGKALFSIGRNGSAGTPVGLGKGDVRQLRLHADAWGNIPVRPGGWFNGALVGVFADGPYQAGFSRDKFFGKTGVLRGMISGLRVGLNVSVVATMSKSAASRMQTAARTGTAIRVGGLGYDAAALTVSEADGLSEVRLPATAGLSELGTPIGTETPVLVGVDVTALG